MSVFVKKTGACFEFIRSTFQPLREIWFDGKILFDFNDALTYIK